MSMFGFRAFILCNVDWLMVKSQISTLKLLARYDIWGEVRLVSPYITTAFLMLVEEGVEGVSVRLTVPTVYGVEKLTVVMLGHM